MLEATNSGIKAQAMDKPKLTQVPVDVERLVHNLLDAFDSLKAKRASLTRSAATEPVPCKCQERLALHPSLDEVPRADATPQQPKTVSGASSIGSLPPKPGPPLMLHPARQVTNPLQLREAFSPAQIQRRYHKMEPSIPYLSEMSETIRRAALAKLQMDSRAVSERRATAWQRIYTLLIWRNHPSPNYETKSRQR